MMNVDETYAEAAERAFKVKAADTADLAMMADTRGPCLRVALECIDQDLTGLALFEGSWWNPFFPEGIERQVAADTEMYGTWRTREPIGELLRAFHASHGWAPSRRVASVRPLKHPLINQFRPSPLNSVLPMQPAIVQGLLSFGIGQVEEVGEWMVHIPNEEPWP